MSDLPCDDKYGETPRVDALVRCYSGTTASFTFMGELEKLCRRLERELAVVKKAHAEAIEEWSRAEGELKSLRSAQGRDIPQGARAVELLREAQKRVSRKWRGHQFDALWLEINDYLASPQPINKETK